MYRHSYTCDKNMKQRQVTVMQFRAVITFGKGGSHTTKACMGTLKVFTVLDRDLVLANKHALFLLFIKVCISVLCISVHI